MPHQKEIIQAISSVSSPRQLCQMSGLLLGLAGHLILGDCIIPTRPGPCLQPITVSVSPFIRSLICNLAAPTHLLRHPGCIR